MIALEERLTAALRETVGSAECCRAVDVPMILAEISEAVLLRRHTPGCVAAPGSREVAVFAISLTPIGSPT